MLARDAGRTAIGRTLGPTVSATIRAAVVLTRDAGCTAIGRTLGPTVSATIRAAVVLTRDAGCTAVGRTLGPAVSATIRATIGTAVVDTSDATGPTIGGTIDPAAGRGGDVVVVDTHENSFDRAPEADATGEEPPGSPTLATVPEGRSANPGAGSPTRFHVPFAWMSGRPHRPDTRAGHRGVVMTLDVGTPTDTPSLTRPDAYRLRLASGPEDLLAAAALRHQVFAGEGGAITPGPPGLDLDAYDRRCDHLIVWHRDLTGSERPVATYRLLPPQANASRPRRRGLYAHHEFDLGPLESLLPGTIEAGRACVAAAHRGSPAIALLWSGIARAMLSSGCRYLVGCASISLDDGGGQASMLESLVQQRYWAPPEWQCRPRRPVPTPTNPDRPDRLTIPPLLHGYFRLGAVICGPPAHDPQFRTADFLVLLDLHQADPRYLRRFVADAGA